MMQEFQEPITHCLARLDFSDFKENEQPPIRHYTDEHGTVHKGLLLRHTLPKNVIDEESGEERPNPYIVIELTSSQMRECIDPNANTDDTII